MFPRTRGSATFDRDFPKFDTALSGLRSLLNLQPLAVNVNFGSWIAFLRLSKEDTSEDAMARIIEFYIPARFHKPAKWLPLDERGKVLEFPAEVRKSA